MLPKRSVSTAVGFQASMADRLTHHVSILTMNGDSYRLKQSAHPRRAAGAEQNQATASN